MRRHDTGVIGLLSFKLHLLGEASNLLFSQYFTSIVTDELRD